MRLVAALLLAAAAAAAAAACSSRSREARPKPPPDAQTGPSFARDIAPVLEQHCTTHKGCHGAEPTDSVPLDLRPAAAWRELVGHPAEMGEAHLLRVKPGDPDDSLIVHKLTGRLGLAEGKAMPIDPDTGDPIDPSPLPPDFVDQVLVPWITAGARNN